MKNHLSLILLLSLLFVSCQKDDFNPKLEDYLVFGHFYGECMGEKCIELFKLEQHQLLEDTNDNYPAFSTYYEGNYVKLSQQKFNEAKDLLNNFPRDLWEDSNKVIGQPDAGDWGGLYIEFKHEGKRKFWFLDLKKSNVPTKYHDFIDEVVTTISTIQ